MDGLVTSEMVREEERLHEESLVAEEKLRHEEEQQAAIASTGQRLHRLKHLLEKSSLYSEFLFKRMKEQESERAAKAARAKKKTVKKEAPASEQQKKPSKRKAIETDIILADYATEADLQGQEEPQATQESKEVGDTFARTIEDGRHISDHQPTMVSGGVLRDYQLKGVEWLKALFENGLNGILADEMGLGKTVQVICFFAHLYEMKVRGPFLVVAPLSTVCNWVAELKRFTPQAPVVLYHGTPAERAEKRKTIMQERKNVGFATVVTSFEVVMKDRRFLSGHRIKNLNCRLIKDLKTFQSANRLLITGTPLQNNLAELWSLLNFLLPDIFDDLDSFQRWFDFSADSADDALLAKEEEEQILTKLHHVLKPFLLRRLKTDVELSIPPKKEVVLYAPLTHKQEAFYKGILNRTIIDDIARRSQDEAAATASKGKRRCSEGIDFKELSDDDQFVRLPRECMLTAQDAAPSRPATAPARSTYTPVNMEADIHIRLQNILMQLRKCCNHPYLLEYPLTASGEYQMDEGLVASSGKMQALDRILPDLKRNQHKVLIFSQMTRMLDILQDYCWLRDYEFVRLDGSVSFAERQARIEAFNKDENVFIFLLSTRAGGLGLNLMAADTVIIYDSDWADLQAQDRCHRIGQTKPVLVLRLITANTVDQRILQRAESKRKLEKLVIHKRRFKGRDHDEPALTSTELLEMLAADAANVVACDDSQVLAEGTIARALDRSEMKTERAGAKEGAFHVL